MPNIITLSKIDDETPTYGEIQAVIRWMKCNSAGGHTHPHTEHLHQWLREAYSAYTSSISPNPTRWIKLLEIIQFMWETGYIPTELGWTVLVISTKGNAYTPGIGLLEVVWKLLEDVIDTRINSVSQFQKINTQVLRMEGGQGLLLT